MQNIHERTIHMNFKPDSDKQLKAQGEQIYMSESGLKFIWIITTDIDEHT